MKDLKINCGTEEPVTELYSKLYNRWNFSGNVDILLFSDGTSVCQDPAVRALYWV